MSLPKQVQRQADAAAEYDRQLAANQEAKPDEDQKAQQTGETPPTEQSKAAEPAPEPTLAPVAQDDEDAKWKQRYLSLQGIFNAQKQQMTELTNTVASLTATIEQLKTVQAQPVSASEPSNNGLVSEQDVEAFGADLVDLARRVAREEFGEREKAYKDEIRELKAKLQTTEGQVSQVASTQAATAQERFFDTLAARMPNWEQLQATPECQAWLGTTVPGTPLTWDAVLREAASRMSVDSVLEVFSAFVSAHPQFAPQKPNKSANAELSRQVAPSKSKASTATPQGERRIYSATEYQAESMRVIRLAQSGKHDEAARLEQELDTALAEGRVSG